MNKETREMRLETHRHNLLAYMLSFIKEDGECKQNPAHFDKECSYARTALDMLIEDARGCGRKSR